MPDTPTTTRAIKPFTYANHGGAKIDIGDPVAKGCDTGTVEKMDGAKRDAIGVRWAGGQFTWEHPKSILYQEEPPKRAFCVTATIAFLDKLTVTLNRFSDGEAPDTEAFPTLLEAGRLIEAAALKAAQR